MARLSKAQLNGLRATARGEVLKDLHGSVYTITGPVGSKALRELMRAGRICDRSRVPRRSKMSMVLTATGRRPLMPRRDSRKAAVSPGCPSGETARSPQLPISVAFPSYSHSRTRC